jgi:bifunctional DNA-binding transcriptional regulator/antitoxin component of YhaV-PrlF toxin-antitoxin module
MPEQEPRSKIIRPVRSGQITIPAEFRQQLGITADTVLQISLLPGELRIRPLSVTPRAAGSPWLKELYDTFAPVREEASHYPEPEIDAAIDEAVQAVRQSHA